MRSSLLVFSGLLLVAAVVMFFYQQSKRGRWRRAQGTVVDTKRNFDGTDKMTAMIVSFLPEGAQAPITFQDPVWTSGTPAPKGKVVTVLYDPANPTSAEIAGWRQYLGPAVLVFLAVVAFICRPTS